MAEAPASDLLQWAIECSDDAVAVVDADLRFTARNAEWVRLFGEGAEAGPVFSALKVGGHVRAVRQGVASSAPVVDRAGGRGRMALQARLDAAGKVEGFTARYFASRDEDYASQDLRAGRRLRLAMEMAQVIAFEFDFRTGACIFDPPSAGPPGARITRFEDILPILPPEAHQDAIDAWHRHLATGEILILEYEWPLADGRRGWHMNACEAIRDAKGDVVGMIGMRQNISARKWAEEEIVAEREAAKAADKAKSEFLANMSHEIRTPLNGVLAMAQVMARGELNPEQCERLGVIRRSGEDLLHVINDILDFSKIEAGHLQLEAISFDAAEALGSTLGAFAATAERKGLGFRLELDEQARGLRVGDPARLRQIVGNFVANALKFTTEGEVCVRVSGEGEQGREGLTIAVQDTGMGIAPDKMLLLFQKFSQVDASTTRQFGGTGLGLAICKELATLMGGRVWADSTPGEGSTFYVSLPMPYAGDGEIEDAAEAEAGGDEGDRAVRVLAAEDNATNQAVLSAVMGVLGFDITLVGNGREAVEAWRAGGFDLILMDVQMPEMDGVTATRTIRAEEARRGLERTPIIVLSANAFTHQVAEYLAAGMDAHVAKPIELPALQAALNRVLCPVNEAGGPAIKAAG